jgi:hypothetical protein
MKAGLFTVLAACLGAVILAPALAGERLPQTKAGGTSSATEEAKLGTLCVIANPPSDSYFANVPFDPKTLMFRIDDGKRTPWPQKTGFKVEGLSLSEKHLVVVYSRGKPIQSFRFRYEPKETGLCLLFDGYAGPDLRPMRKSCGCG